MATRDELMVAVRERYANSERGEKTRILDEFVAVTGFHRKHAMRLLRGEQTARGTPRPARQAVGRRDRGRRYPARPARQKEGLGNI
jgi:hypothetical protein